MLVCIVLEYCYALLRSHYISSIHAPYYLCVDLRVWEDDEQTTRLLLTHDSTFCQYGTFKPQWVAPCTRKLFFVDVHVLPNLSFLQSDIRASQATIACCLEIFFVK